MTGQPRISVHPLSVPTLCISVPWMAGVHIHCENRCLSRTGHRSITGQDARQKTMHTLRPKEHFLSISDYLSMHVLVSNWREPRHAQAEHVTDAHTALLLLLYVCITITDK